MRLLLVGNPEPFHIGAHFRDAAEELGIPIALCDMRQAFAASALEQRITWHLLGKRPPRLEGFSAQVLRTCQEFHPTHLLTTGIAPLTEDTLTKIGAQKIRMLNFLTDDPWNATQRAEWFLEALPDYDEVFTPRRANVDDLRKAGCARVEYCAFAYNPRVHFRDMGSDTALASDVLFAGEGDTDRLPYVAGLVRDHFQVRLYGGYWDRFAETRGAYYGHADLDTLRRAVRQARVCLNLVRRANRDGHVMRTYEAPAMGGCLLMEDTSDHRELFGTEGEAVLYFRSTAEIVAQARRLCDDDALRARLRQSAHERITRGKNTYADRLREMLQV
jgi:spore maturation protein CgeB